MNSTLLFKQFCVCFHIIIAYRAFIVQVNIGMTFKGVKL